MITLIPIEPLNEKHGALIVVTFSYLFVDRGGQPDGDGDGYGNGNGDGNGNGWGNGYGNGWGAGDGNGNGWGNGYGNGWGAVAGFERSKILDEWRVE